MSLAPLQVHGRMVTRQLLPPNSRCPFVSARAHALASLPPPSSSPHSRTPLNLTSPSLISPRLTAPCPAWPSPAPLSFEPPRSQARARSCLDGGVAFAYCDPATGAVAQVWERENATEGERGRCRPERWYGVNDGRDSRLWWCSRTYIWRSFLWVFASKSCHRAFCAPKRLPPR